MGNFPKLQKAVGKKPDEMWSEDDRVLFSSTYTRFSIEFKQQGGEEIKITPGDAFLAFTMLYGYDTVLSLIHILTCINCPVGCSLKVEMDGENVICVSGNTCRRGEI